MNKRPFIYLGLAVAFVLIVLFLERPDRPRVGLVDSELVYPEFDMKSVEECSVEQLLNGVDIRRSDDGWEVSRRITPMQSEVYKKENKDLPPPAWHKADVTRVDTAIANFTDLERGVIVSSNPEKQAQYNLGPVGLKVICKDKNGVEMVNLVIGKNGPDFISTYLNKSGTNDVMLISRSMVGVFSPNIDDWRDRTIFPVSPVDVVEINIKDIAQVLGLKKNEDGNWRMTAPRETDIDIAKAKDLMNKIIGVDVDGFAYGDEALKVDFKNPELDVIIKSKEGKSFDLKISGRDAKENFYAKVEGDDTIFLLNKDSVNGMREDVKGIIGR